MSRKKRIKAAVLLALCGCALAVGVLLLAVGVSHELRYLGSKNWPTVRGRVTYAAAQTETTPWYDFPRTPHGTFRPPGKVRFGVVEYEYTVGGKTHRSRVEVSGMLESSTLVSRFSRGTRVRVFYDPGHPGRSTLMPGIDKNSMALHDLMATTLLTMAGIGLRGTIRYWRRT